MLTVVGIAQFTDNAAWRFSATNVDGHTLVFQETPMLAFVFSHSEIHKHVSLKVLAPLYRKKVDGSTRTIYEQWHKSLTLSANIAILHKPIAGFHSRDQQPCFSTKTKGSVCIIIELNSRRIWSGHQHGRLFFV